MPGKWNDLNSGVSPGYVVEYGGNPGDPATTLTQKRNIKLIATSLETSVSGNVYSLHAPAVPVDVTATVYSYTSITDARVTISSGFQTGDVLAVTTAMPAGVSSSYNSTTALLSFTGTATPAEWQAVFRGVSFTSTSNVVGNRIVTFSLGNLISGSNGHFYQFVNTLKNYSTAKSDASASSYLGLNGYLATITSETENEFIRHKLTSDGWIGASDDASEINATPKMPKYAGSAEGQWHWITGPEAGQQMTTANAPGGGLPPVSGTAYNNWNLGEPNNHGSGENFGQFYGSGTTPGKWNDLPASSSQGSVIEYGGLSTDPLLALSGNRTMLITSILAAGNLQFDATMSGEGVRISWSTSSETNTGKFEVLFSRDGSNFVPISETKAAGNSSSLKIYSFTHISPVQGVNYYQLKTIDLDGSVSLSKVEIVKFSKAKFTISPNPVDKQCTVSNPFAEQATLSIKNISGAVIGKWVVNANTTVIDLSSLKPGIYLASIYNDKQQSEVARFIKR
jgi:hypothetical protein